MKNYFLIFLFLYSSSLLAQLSLCEGSKGDPIFHEDFGTGNSNGPPLTATTTNYTYAQGNPGDGEYTISNRLNEPVGNWHAFLPATTVSQDRALFVNASYSSGIFYKKQISGLCENTTYEFSAFLLNIYNRSLEVCPDGGIPVNVRFEIWDETDSELLTEGSTGDIPSTHSPQWDHYGLTFQTEPGQESIIFKMYNNGDGGCGNDLAIDDIIFRSCGDLTTVTSENNENDEKLDEYIVCEPDTPVSLKLTATPDYSVYEEHAFQWQESEDNSNWQDIPGETDTNYSTPALNSSKYYRVKVAEDEVNLSNNLCNSASEAYFIHITETPQAPLSNGDIAICSGDEIPPLSVGIEEGETVNWYDAETGGNLLAEGTDSFIPEGGGVFYAEAVREDYDCEGRSLTAVSLEVNESPQVEDEELQLCEEGELQLDTGLDNMDYQWSTGENTKKITITRPGSFSVEVTNEEGCSATKYFEVRPVDIAGIEEISSEENQVTIIPLEEGEFEYSLDGTDFQVSNVFNAVEGGIYTAYIRDQQKCKIVSEEFPHIVVPKFITPNNDGYNDSFVLEGLEYFNSSEIRIFDRYGKLLEVGTGENFSWSGTFNGRNLPAADYWYEIIIEGYDVTKGHFSLIR